MAKDGTMRGGSRSGSGKKRKAVTDKVADGQTATLIPMPDTVICEPVPPLKEYLKREQADGEILQAETVYRDTYEWLDKLGCRHVIAPQLIEQYSMNVARWIQCENAVSEYGIISSNPDAKMARVSPYVKAGHDYMKQASQLWYTIYQTVRENASVTYSGATPQDSAMENLLAVRGG